MTTGQTMGAFAGGMLAGNVILLGAVHWIRAIKEIRKSRILNSPMDVTVTQILGASVLNSGPWLLLVAASFFYYISPNAWAVPLFAGVVCWLAFVSILVCFGAWKRRRREILGDEGDAPIDFAREKHRAYVYGVWGGIFMWVLTVWQLWDGGMPLWFFVLAFAWCVLGGYGFGYLFWAMTEPRLQMREVERRRSREHKASGHLT